MHKRFFEGARFIISIAESSFLLFANLSPFYIMREQSIVLCFLIQLRVCWKQREGISEDSYVLITGDTLAPTTKIEQLCHIFLGVMRGQLNREMIVETSTTICPLRLIYIYCDHQHMTVGNIIR